MKNVIVIGAGGHGKVIADIVLRSGDNVIGFLDDNVNQPSKIIGIPYLGTVSKAHEFKGCAFVIGIGDNHIRKKIAETYHLIWYTAIHPSAQIAVDTKIGKGTVVMANAVINASATIKDHCIINTSSVIEHDDSIDDYVHISPNATICGGVHIGELTHIGAGASIRNNVNICENTIVGMGSVVVKPITIQGVYKGVPAMKYEYNVNKKRGGEPLITKIN